MVAWYEVPMRFTICAISSLILFGAFPVVPAEAQLGRAAIGGGVGVAGGAVLTLSVIVARARFQNVYVESADDLIHWQSVPMVLAPAAGIAFGLAGREPLVDSIVGSTGGMVLGMGLGAGIGWLASDSAEAPWAGAVIGAGIGMTIGGLLMGVRAWIDETDSVAVPARMGFRIAL
jgi:hypothetical protein